VCDVPWGDGSFWVWVERVCLGTIFFPQTSGPGGGRLLGKLFARVLLLTKFLGVGDGSFFSSLGRRGLGI